MAVLEGLDSNNRFLSRLPEEDRLAIRASQEEKAYIAARHIGSDSGLLAITLQDGGLVRGERNALIRELVSGQDPASGMSAIYSDIYALPGEQQRVIAEAIDQAYRDGAIEGEHLLAIADFNATGNGAQRFVSLLDASPLSSRPGGSIEGLGTALLDRANANPGAERSTLDYYGAAVAFSQGREIYARNRGTEAERIAMFEAAVQVNDSGFSGILSGSTNLFESWRREGLATAGRLFADNTRLISDHFTALGADNEVMAQFFAQTIFNPDARHIALDTRRDLIPSVNRSLDVMTSIYTSRAETADSQLGREEAFRALGTLAAGVSGGSVVALDRYSGEIRESEAFRDEMAALLTSAIKPFFKSLPAPGAHIAGNASKDLAAAIIDQFIQYPDRPDTSFANDFSDALELGIREFEAAHGFDGLLTAFQASWSGEFLKILNDLNLNTGGHR